MRKEHKEIVSIMRKKRDEKALGWESNG